MFKTIFYKEILENLTSHKFLVVLALCLIIIPLGTYVNTRDYQYRLDSYQESLRQYEDSRKVLKDFIDKGEPEGFRPPSPMSFLSSGLEIIMPNVAQTPRTGRPGLVDRKLDKMNLNNDQPLDNLYEFYHGPLDLVFIISVIMTFFCIIFTYGAIAGEKEQGTLKYILCNSVPRHCIILAKMCSNFLALIIPFLIAMLLSLLLFQGKHFTLFGSNETSPYILLGVLFSLLLVSVFFNLGMLISSLNKQAASSIIILLFCWILLYGIIPRLSVVASKIVYPIKSQQLINFEKNQIRLNNEKDVEMEINRLINTGQNSSISQQAIRDEYWAKLESQIQNIDRDIEKKRNTQLRLTTNLARLSPVGCFVRPMSEISHTGWLRYLQFQEEATRFRQILNKQFYSKFEVFEEKGGGGYSNFKGDDSAPAPRFTTSQISFGDIMRNVLPDLVLLVIYNLILFSAAFVGFLKYDVR